VISNRQRAWRRLLRNPIAVIGGLMVMSVILAAIFAPWAAPFPTHAGAVVDFRHRHSPPDALHWMGTDNAGRDILSRVIFGYRVSLALVAGVLGIAMPFGVLLGMAAGYFRGRTEFVIMRLTDIMLAMPPLVMALAITAILTPDLVNAMIAITALWWTWHCRLIYRITSSIVAEDFVEAARLSGATHTHILLREILPNCMAAISVKTTLDAGFVILFGATLSFLGLGVQPPTPDLGTMVATGAQFLPDQWWEAVMPGLGVLYAILGFNLLGDGLRDMLDVEIG
jgi:peptide/nickel transport system permease protein